MRMAEVLGSASGKGNPQIAKSESDRSSRRPAKDQLKNGANGEIFRYALNPAHSRDRVIADHGQQLQLCQSSRLIHD